MVPSINMIVICFLYVSYTWRIPFIYGVMGSDGKLSQKFMEFNTVTGRVVNVFVYTIYSVFVYAVNAAFLLSYLHLA